MMAHSDCIKSASSFAASTVIPVASSPPPPSSRPFTAVISTAGRALKQAWEHLSQGKARFLAEALYLTGDIERYGTRFVRIREILRAYPEIVLGVEEMCDFFKVLLQQVAQVTPPISPPITPPITGVGDIPITDLERRILLMLHDTPTLTGSHLAKDFGIRRGTVKEYLRRLKAKGLLVREGSTRTGRWRLTEAGRAAIDRDE